jgi:N-acetylneuraminic acid mutarotase
MNRVVDKLVLAAVFAGGVAGYAHGLTELAWMSKAPMSTSRNTFGAAVVNGAIYCGGGSSGNSENPSILSSWEKYDPAADKWTALAGMPEARYWYGTAVVNGKIYVVCGNSTWNGSAKSTVFEYNPSSNTWATKWPIVAGDANVGACWGYGSLIYCASGTGFHTYNTLSGAWSNMANTSMNNSNGPTPSVVLVGSKAYVANSAYDQGNQFISYDNSTGLWHELTPWPSRRIRVTLAALNGRIYLLGGNAGQNDNAPLGTVEEYDPPSDSWNTRAINTAPRAESAAATLGGKIYLMGGNTAAMEATVDVDLAVRGPGKGSIQVRNNVLRAGEMSAIIIAKGAPLGGEVSAFIYGTRGIIRDLGKKSLDAEGVAVFSFSPVGSNSDKVFPPGHFWVVCRGAVIGRKPLVVVMPASK